MNDFITRVHGEDYRVFQLGHNRANSLSSAELEVLTAQKKKEEEEAKKRKLTEENSG